MGAMKTFQYGKPRVPIDLDKYVLAGRYIKLGDPQILCTACDWTGLREDVRFTKRRKKTKTPNDLRRSKEKVNYGIMESCLI
jgi:hypothetical protein